ncbi:HERV-H LTR-associating protein 2 [Manis javanica]|nr:HERV-H LTR-associating protein 2 [Manis javanica]
MKAQAALSFFLILLLSPSGCQDTLFLASFFHLSTMNEQTVIGRLDEDVILPCTFESGPEVVIHWKNQDNKIYKYYKNSDQLENQDARYRNRTSLFHSEIHNGNASLSLRKLSLLDEGIYVCYVGTATRKITHKVVLKVGAFITPAMKYEKRNTNSFLICSVLSVYPRPIITWQVDNIPTSASSMEENGSLGPFYVNSRINITGSNSSYECAIENSLLEQTWTGRWTMKDGLHKMQSENFSLSCEFWGVLMQYFFKQIYFTHCANIACRTESKDTCPDNYSVFAFGGFGFAGNLHNLNRDDTFTATQAFSA